MNALVSIDRILSPETIDPPADILTPAIVFAPGGVEKIIADLETTVRATERDMTTEAGREAIKSLAYKVSRSKTALDDMGKEVVADWKKLSGKVDAERKIIRDRLDALRDEVRGPLTAWEDAEKARVEGHEKAIVWLIESPRFPATPTSAEITLRIEDATALCLRTWDEFHERGEVAASEASATLKSMLAAAIQAEADAAELAELRQLKADREAADQAAADAATAAETARIEAEQKAADEATLAEQLKARDIAQAEQAARDAATAAAKAVEDERLRVAAVAAEEKAAADKREANKKHRAKIHGEIGGRLLAWNIDPDTAELLIQAIAGGDIPHVSITY